MPAVGGRGRKVVAHKAALSHLFQPSQSGNIQALKSGRSCVIWIRWLALLPVSSSCYHFATLSWGLGGEEYAKYLANSGCLIEGSYHHHNQAPMFSFLAAFWFTFCSLVAQMVKRLSTMRETWVLSLGQKIPWRRKWQSIPVLLPGKPHGQRSLVGYSPWGRKELDTTEWLHFTSLC